MNKTLNFKTFKTFLQLILLVVSVFGFSQTPALEMADGDSNPTTNQANVFQNTTIRMRTNTNNPTGNTFATYNPALNVTFALSNQQYTQTNFTGYNGATYIGYTNEPQLVLLNAFGSTTSSTPFTSSGVASGTGIDITANRAVQINNNVQPLTAANRATNGRWQMADLTITFNRPVNNPYLQINALGGLSNSMTYTAEFDYVSSNVPVTFSKISGTTELNVTSTQILNSGVTPNGSTSAGRGTVLVSGTGITTLTLRIYTRGAAANTGTNWHGTSNISGDGYMIGVTMLESDLRVTKTVSNATPTEGSNIVFTVTASNLGASNNSNVTVNDLLPSGYTYVSHTASTGTYVPGTGVWTIGNLNDQANATLTITAIVNATGNFTNTATISTTSGIADPNTTNNTASVSTTPVITDSDGDGVPNAVDLDDDNDGILDCAENGLDKPIGQIFKLNGSATQISSNEVQLTPASNSQAGQMWSYGEADFTKNFSIPFEAYLGNNDAGADGMAIVFQNDPAGINAIGAAGGGIGASGIQNGVVLELDTYSNTGSPALDPAADHGQIWKSSDQTAITSTVALPNLEDGAWHAVVVNWDSASQTLSYTVDGTLAGTYIGNIVTNYFGGANKVYFGFTASTGGLNNDQRVRFSSLCSLPLELDTDGDGTPNYLDLDSDRDDCPDAIEGGDNVTAGMLDGIGRINVAANGTTTPVVVDANGVPVVTNTSSTYNVDGQAQGQTIGQSQINNPAAVAGTVGSNQTIVSGSAPSALSLTGSTGTIQWQSSTDNVTFTNISGATSATYAPGALTATTYYRAVLTSAGGCTANSTTVTINIDSDGDGVPDYQDLDSDNDGILDIFECTQSVVDVNFSVANGNSQTFSAPAADLGFIFDVYTLDNSFTLTVNGASISSSKLEFQPNQTDNVRFVDGNTYGNGTVPQIYTMTGTAANPLVRIIIHKNGAISMYGSKTSGGPLFPLQLYNGNNFNTIIWNQTSANTVVVSQVVVGATYISGRGNGVRNGFCDSDNDGISNQFDVDSDNDGCADAIEGSENVKYNQIHDLNLPLADPNYAYRGQIKVTYNGTTTSTPSGIISNSPSANGVPQLLNNAGNNLNASTNPSNLAGAVDNTDGTADIGQGIGDSQDNTINSCKCYKASSTDGNNYPTQHGITAFNRAGTDNQNWPMVRQSGWTALEASTKGFVINRMPVSTSGENTGEPVDGSNNAVITSPIAGMMFYDTTNDCLKINVDGTRSGWKCFNNQSCPDEN